MQMESLLLSTTTATTLGPKSLLQFHSQPSFCNGDSSIFTSKLISNKNKARLLKPSLVLTSQWRFEQPRERQRGRDQFQNPWEHQRDHGHQFENPWERPTVRDHDHGHGDNRNKGEFGGNTMFEHPAESIMDVPIVSWEDLQYPAGELGAIPEPPEIIDHKKQMDYLTRILRSSKVYDVTKESPLQLAPKLSKGLGVNLWLKREDSQPGYTFTTRGAYNLMANLPKDQLKKGVVCAPTGNHAQGIALAAKKLGSEAVIVLPTSTPPIKVETIENLGGKVVLYGDTYDDSLAHARRLCEQMNLPIISPFDNEDVIIGQGTVGMEIARQMRDQVHSIFVPVGGGDLLAGVASFYKLVSPEVKIIGVEPRDANSMASALHNNQIVKLDKVGTFADGAAVKQVGVENFRICRELVDGIVLVDKDDISNAIKQAFEDTGSVLDPTGALSIAGAKAYCKYNNINGVNVVAVTSDANMNFDQLASIANYGNETEATFATILPEKTGSLRSFFDMVGPKNITEIKYRYNPGNEAVVLYSVGVNAASELEDAKMKIESSPFETYNLTENEVVKDHLRYMVGGRSKVPNEVLCRFILPERPGALANLLDAFSPRWNISLIHYRGQGMISADVLAGFQVPESETAEFHESAKKLGFDYTPVPNDPASKRLTQL